jgi:hypothetical protein
MGFTPEAFSRPPTPLSTAVKPPNARDVLGKVEAASSPLSAVLGIRGHGCIRKRCRQSRECQTQAEHFQRDLCHRTPKEASLICRVYFFGPLRRFLSRFENLCYSEPLRSISVEWNFY